MIKAVIILSVIIVILIGIIYLLFRNIDKQKTEIKSLSKNIDKFLLQIKSLTDYISELKKIKIDEDNFQQKLSEAENEEDIFAVINGIVKSNNDRVQNNKDKGSSTTATKTTKSRKTGSNKS